MDKMSVYVMYDLQCGIMLMSFVISLRLIKNKNIPQYLKNFYWYNIVGVMVMVPHFLTFHFFKQFYYLAIILNNLTLIFHYGFLGNFIIKAGARPQRNLKQRIVFWCFLFLTFYFISTGFNKKSNTSAFAMANFGLSLLCILYYLQLFNYIPVLDIKRQPAFWIITGIFFCMSLPIPLFGVIEYLRSRVAYNKLQFFAIIGPICYSIMHLFFIKAYLCALHPQKASWFLLLYVPY